MNIPGTTISHDFIEISAFSKYTRAGMTVLDVGCGPGQNREATAANYIGMDMEIDHRGGFSGADILGDAMRMPFREGMFDFLYCRSLFYMLPGQADALREFRRALKDGGRIVIVDYNYRGLGIVSRKENARRPRWTQWGLRGMLSKNGFRDTDILVPHSGGRTGGLGKLAQLIREELTGQWAVVTGVK